MAQKPEAFTSIRIISSKAQQLWSKAKARVMNAKEHQKNTDISLPSAKNEDSIIIDIPAATVAKVVLTVIGLVLATWILFVIRDKILVIVLSIFLALAIHSSVRFLERYRFPRSLAIILVYVVFLSFVVLLVASLIPIVAPQLQDLTRFVHENASTFLANPTIELPLLSDATNLKLSELLKTSLSEIGLTAQTFSLEFSKSVANAAQVSLSFVVNIAGSVANFVVNVIFILFLTFFIHMEREKLITYFRFIVPRMYRGYYDAKAEAISHKISEWFKGQIILCLSIGILVFIALSILGMPYAPTLALLAAFTEIIPVVGPIIAAVPAILIALTQEGFVMAGIVAIIFYVIQFCENNILVPLVMKHAVGLSPIAVMIGALVGISFPDTIHPILGIILAVPATAIITIFLKDLYELQKRK